MISSGRAGHGPVQYIDNGAGGLSSSVGEMAGDTGGCRLDLAKAPLKYDGLRPWEILLSEAQERGDPGRAAGKAAPLPGPGR